MERWRSRRVLEKMELPHPQLAGQARLLPHGEKRRSIIAGSIPNLLHFSGLSRVLLRGNFQNSERSSFHFHDHQCPFDAAVIKAEGYSVKK